MKHKIVLNKKPVSEILLSDILSERNLKILAIKARAEHMNTIDKYVLYFCPVLEMYRFIDGNGCWDYDSNLKDLLTRIVQDSRTELYAFTAIKDLAEWILEK